VEPVTAGDDVAAQRLLAPLVAEANRGPLGPDSEGGGMRNIEPDVTSGGDACGDQVLHHLLLTVDRDRTAGQGTEVDTVAASVELEVDTAMDEALAAHPLTHPQGPQEIDGPLLEDTGTDAGLDISAVALLEDH
jgi:hypothetical protein